MKSLTLIAALTLVSTAVAAPTLARGYCDTHRCYHRGPGGAAADTAAGVAEAAIGTAGAIATAPFRNFYAYDRNDPHAYWGSKGYVCEPGTWFKSEDGRRHPCQ